MKYYQSLNRYCLFAIYCISNIKQNYFQAVLTNIKVISMKNFLPMTMDEMKDNDAADFIIVTGDAYIDHSSFGASVIGRILESKGYSVGIIAQPDWKIKEDFMKLAGRIWDFLLLQEI